MTSAMPSRSELRRGLEKKVLIFMLADVYEKFPQKLAQERGITLTPLPALNVDRSNPAVFTCCLLVEHEARDPSPQKGNLLVPDTENG